MSVKARRLVGVRLIWIRPIDERINRVLAGAVGTTRDQGSRNEGHPEKGV